ncbi:hypothetical protein [Sphingomonas hankookensis]|uniref:hypothetical protein n=1 Tax=Sphingomonas hankookensis TaxID=563996 RepID=UPI003F7AA9F7
MPAVIATPARVTFCATDATASVALTIAALIRSAARSNALPILSVERPKSCSVFLARALAAFMPLSNAASLTLIVVTSDANSCCIRCLSVQMKRAPQSRRPWGSLSRRKPQVQSINLRPIR